MNNNLIIDKENKIKIPQNSLLFFDIQKSLDWSHTIDIIINYKLEINLLNLYLILKSFSLSLIYPSVYIIIRIKRNSEKLIISEKMNSSSIINLNFMDFENWFYYRLSYDSKYIKSDSLYCFSVTFNNMLVDNNDILFLKPNYPWKDSILSEIRDYENKDLIILEKINIYENNLFELFIENLNLRIKNISTSSKYLWIYKEYHIFMHNESRICIKNLSNVKWFKYGLIPSKWFIKNQIVNIEIFNCYFKTMNPDFELYDFKFKFKKNESLSWILYKCFITKNNNSVVINYDSTKIISVLNIILAYYNSIDNIEILIDNENVENLDIIDIFYLLYDKKTVIIKFKDVYKNLSKICLSELNTD